MIYNSISSAFKAIWTEEGLRGFYRGLSASLVQIFPYMGLMFSGFNVTNTVIKPLEVVFVLIYSLFSYQNPRMILFVG